MCNICYNLAIADKSWKMEKQGKLLCIALSVKMDYGEGLYMLMRMFLKNLMKREKKIYKKQFK